MINRVTYDNYRKDAIYKKFDGKCAICGKPLSRKTMTIAHIVPLSKGGDNGYNNLVLCCWECSHAKNNLTMDEFFMKIHEIYLYNKKEILNLVTNN